MFHKRLLPYELSISVLFIKYHSVKKKTSENVNNVLATEGTASNCNLSALHYLILQQNPQKKKKVQLNPKNCCCWRRCSLPRQFDPPLGVTAQHLQAEGDVVDPAPWMDTEVAGEQRRLENCENFLIRIVVACEDLMRKGKSKKSGNSTERGHLSCQCMQFLRKILSALEVSLILSH